MRRGLILVTCVATIFAMASPSAWAQVKDPFDPLLVEGTTTDPADGTDPTTTTTTTTTTADPEPPAGVPMPSTGMDPMPWLGLAALAFALGAGLLLVGRVLDPS